LSNNICPTESRYTLFWTVHKPCGSGFTREETNAVSGTGFAGVRG
jgi:hypothetical protein